MWSRSPSICRPPPHCDSPSHPSRHKAPRHKSDPPKHLAHPQAQATDKPSPAPRDPAKTSHRISWNRHSLLQRLQPNPQASPLKRTTCPADTGSYCICRQLILLQNPPRRTIPRASRSRHAPTTSPAPTRPDPPALSQSQFILLSVHHLRRTRRIVALHAGLDPTCDPAPGSSAIRLPY